MWIVGSISWVSSLVNDLELLARILDEGGKPMPLLNDGLSVWEIAFRWAGKDPDHLRIRLPLAVRDYFRLMMDAILRGRLDCDTLSLNKWKPEDGDDMQPHFIRYHLGKVEACIHGTKFDRDLMRWARVERWSFKSWCEGQGIALPEFWFPSGWNLDYKFRDEDDESGEVEDASSPAHLRPDQRRRIACQVIAEAIWKEKPDTTIAAMVGDGMIRRYGGAQYQAEEVVRRWLSEVAPAEVKAKRGRPAKKKGTQSDPPE